MSRYWDEEPWGTWRDNLHAAIVAREVRRTAYKGAHSLDDFMVMMKRDEQQVESNPKESLFGLLRALAGVRTKVGTGKKTKALKP